VVANVVIIGLGQRHPNHARNQQADPQQSPHTPLIPAS
jgi:hypothetical protein